MIDTWIAEQLLQLRFQISTQNGDLVISSAYMWSREKMALQALLRDMHRIIYIFLPTEKLILI